MTNIIDVSHEKSSLKSYFDKIATAWHKTAQSILETGQFLLEAEKQLKLPEYKKLKEQLISNNIMSSSTISKLQQIARNVVLCKPEYQKQLPPSYESLYILSRKDDNVLEEKIASHAITAETERKEISTIFRPVQSTTVQPETKIKGKFSKKGSISIDTSKINEKDYHSLVKLLNKLSDAGVIKVTGDILNEG